MAPESVSTDDLATPEFCAALDFEALITDEQAQQIDSDSESWGRNRRLILGLLTRSKAALLDRVSDLDESARIYLEMLDAVGGYKEQLDIWREQADLAEARVLCVMGSIHERLGSH